MTPAEHLIDAEVETISSATSGESVVRRAAAAQLPDIRGILERLRGVLDADAVVLSSKDEGPVLRAGADAGGITEASQRYALTLRLPDGAPAYALEVVGQLNPLAQPEDAARVTSELDLLRSVLAQRHLREEGARQLGETRMLLELAQTTSGTVDVETILHIACGYFQRLIGVKEAIIHQADEQGQLLRPVRSGGDTPVPAGPASADEIPTITRIASRERRPVFGTELAQVPDLPGAEHDLVPLIALPMVNRDELLGVVTLLDPPQARGLSFQQTELARATVGQLALSIANARLYESLWRSYADLAAARAQMVKRERLAALGELSAIVAHEVRNPLGVIFNAISTLRKIVPADEDSTMLVDMVAEESDRLNRIVGDLLDFSRPRDLDLEEVPVAELVEQAIEVARATAVEVPGPVTFDVRGLEAALVVRVDRRLMRQALINVLLNAVQAAPMGGAIAVHVVHEQLAGAPSVCIEIIDSGAGIPPELRARIFEPFFTTKARGTGLGLAVLKRIVEDHGGSVSAESRLGAGATFRIRLPLAEAPGTDTSIQGLSPGRGEHEL